MIEELGHCLRWKRIFQLSTVYEVARRKRFTTPSGAWPIPADVLIFDVTASGNSATWCNGLLWSLGHHTISVVPEALVLSFPNDIVREPLAYVPDIHHNTP